MLNLLNYTNGPANWGRQAPGIGLVFNYTAVELEKNLNSTSAGAAGAAPAPVFAPAVTGGKFD